MSRLFVGADPRITSPTAFIEFDETPVTTNSGYTMDTSFKINKIDTSVNDINPQNLARFQNTGIETTEVILTGKVNDDNNQFRKNLRRFALLDDITTQLPHGIFGFELDNYEEFNLTPSTVRGARVQSMELARPVDEPTRVGFVATMRIFGNKGVASNDFAWT